MTSVKRLRWTILPLIGAFALVSITAFHLSRAFAASGKAASASMFLYVSTQGDDAWSGHLPAPVAGDGPFRTLTRARDEIRLIRKRSGLPPRGVTVVVRGGDYFLAETLALSEEDSGWPEAPVVYRAADGERVRLFGGRILSGFVPYRGEILKTDVAAQNLKGKPFRQLLFDGHRQPLARYPNVDPVNPHTGGWAYADGEPVSQHKVVPGENKHTLLYRLSDERTWASPSDGEVFVFPRHNWNNDILPIRSVDRVSRTITLGKDATFAIRPYDRYFVQGLFEELDAPGEWYLDRMSWTLYFWPPSPLAGKRVCVPVLDTLIALGQGTTCVTIRGFEIQCCEKTAIMLTGTKSCRVERNIVHNVGGYRSAGIGVSGGTGNAVTDNELYDIGATGISLNGGDMRTLTPAGNFAENNRIYRVGVFNKESSGIALSGVGNRASHNLIHDTPRFGIRFTGNFIVIEYNHIHRTNLETEDTGAIYTGARRDWLSARGSCIRYNFIHDSGGYGQTKPGQWKYPHCSWGIYLDSTTCGVDIIGNIIVRACRGAVFVHNGRNNRILNNVFADCASAQFLMGGWGKSTWDMWLPTMVRAYESVMNEPAWHSLPGMNLHPLKATEHDLLNAADNRIERNIIYYTSVTNAQLFKITDALPERNVFDYNLAWSGSRPLVIACGTRMPIEHPFPKHSEQDTPTNSWPVWWQARGLDRHSVVADPLFVAPANDDYRLKANSPAFGLGFKPIPIEQIGPSPNR